MRGTFEEPPTVLIPWFSKTEGNTYATIAASPFPLQGKPTQAQDVGGGCFEEGIRRLMCDIHTNRNVFLGLTVWDVATS